MLESLILDILLLCASTILTWYLGFNVARYSSATRLVRDIAKDGVEYWQSPYSESKYLEHSIKLRLVYLSTEIEPWSRSEEIVVLHSLFRDALTDGNFETSRRCIEDRNARIEDSSKYLLNKLANNKIPLIITPSIVLRKFWNKAFRY